MLVYTKGFPPPPPNEKECKQNYNSVANEIQKKNKKKDKINLCTDR